MTRKPQKVVHNKKDLPAVSTRTVGCCLQKIPPLLFGENVLHLLRPRDICRLDTAICDSHLREYWWVGPKRFQSRPLMLDVCLRHAINPFECLPVRVNSDRQVQWMQRRGVNSTRLLVNALKVEASSFHVLLVEHAYLGQQLDSIVIKALYIKSRTNAYLRTLSLCSSLQSISLEFIRDDGATPTLCRDVLINNPQLSKLSLSFGLVHYFAPFLHEARALKHLRIKSARPGELSLAHLLPLGPQLESLAMNDFPYPFIDILIMYFEAHPNCPLRSIDLSRPYSTDIHVSGACVRAIASSCPLLESLHIGNRSGRHNAEVMDDDIVFLAERCPCLKLITLNRYCQLTVSALDALLLHCPLLSEVCVIGTAISEEYAEQRRVELLALGRVIAFRRHQCVVCGAREMPVKMCSACRNVYYCSERCQRADWYKHKRVCSHDL